MDNLQIEIKVTKIITFRACELKEAIISNIFATKDLIINQHS